jgi:transposase-like protein
MKKVSQNKIKEQNNFIKKGFCNGVQKIYNKETGRTHLETYKDIGFPAETKAKALELYLEGTSLRSVGRLLNCSHVSVINWIKEAANKIKDEPLFEDLSEDELVIEIDEMWHFCQKKRKSGGFGLLSTKKQNK